MLLFNSKGVLSSLGGIARLSPGLSWW